ncbi:transmembrane protein 220 [Lonchura striata]
MAARLWRLCNLLMAAFFGLAAAVQVRPGLPSVPPLPSAGPGSQCAPPAAGERPRRGAVDGCLLSASCPDTACQHQPFNNRQWCLEEPL